MLELNKIYNQDCLEGMQYIDDKSINMILCDLPYGTTACSWDVIIPFDKLWEEYERIIKPNGAIVLTSTQPFTTDLINSNRKIFKYCWIWDKIICSGALLSKKQPMRAYEDVCIFYKKQPTYNPQLRDKPKDAIRKNNIKINNNSQTYSQSEYLRNEHRSIPTDKSYPTNIIRINQISRAIKKINPTQKSVELFEYLIKTYTNKGDLVLDNCIGSGTTAIAALNTNRNYIGFEWSPSEPHDQYFNLAVKRVEDYQNTLKL